MKLEDILAALKRMIPLLKKQYGIESIGVFGSIARGDANENSDIDIVVEMPPDLYAMINLKDYLEEALDAPVDLVRYRSTMNELLKKRINREAIYV